MTNSPAVEQALVTIRGVIAQAEALRDKPLTDQEIETAITKLRQKIPEVIETIRQEQRFDFAPLLSNEPKPLYETL